jgi:glycine C-acetyltransferase
MAKADLFKLFRQETSRLDEAGVSKRHEHIIEGFTFSPSPRALISGKPYHIFNSNDYLGLRFNPQMLEAEHEAAKIFGTGPGAVRFISGSLAVHRELETALAQFHGRDDAIVFSSAFAANLAVISSLIKGQSKDSLVGSDTLVLSDQLNHRSIVEGIRVANLPDTQRLVFPHFDFSTLRNLLSEHVGKFSRALILTDGVFSMLGQYTDLKELTAIAQEFDSKYPLGVLLFVDDCHGIGVLGGTGRGVEEVYSVQSDVLVGTLGKAFGTDGGYVVANQATIDYLRESAATYIYSNPISAGTAAAARKALSIVASPSGKKLLVSLQKNISGFKNLIRTSKIKLAADSGHAIQPLLIGDTLKAKELEMHLFKNGILVTGITYPVVPKGQDEIRVQLSALHTDKDLDEFASALSDFSV